MAVEPQSEADEQLTDAALTGLTAFQRDMLHVMRSLGPAKGLSIKERLEHIYHKEVNHGRLYPNLDQLVDAGLATKDQRDRRTNEYALTDRGRRELDARNDWQRACAGEVE